MALAPNMNKAFRTAYDELNKVFPPEFSGEYFKKVAEEFAPLACDPDEPLTRRLLQAVYAYLEEYAKEKAGVIK